MFSVYENMFTKKKSELR